LQNIQVMQIQDIKNRLTLSEVIHHYGLKADKQNRLKCPFHNDKTPSLQLYYKTQTAFCFSTNCTTHGKSLDVIDFIMYYEKCSKHAAILKAQEILTVPRAERYGKAVNKAESIISPGAATAPTFEDAKVATNGKVLFLERMFTYFKNAVHNSKPAQEYLQSRCLDFRNTEVGYNAGQFHHGARKNETLINECLKYGILLDMGIKSRTGDTAYKAFGKWCVVFALRNQQNEIVSLYFRSTLAKNDASANATQGNRHFYLRDRQGLYPGYPPAETKKLILTESIIDAASLLEQGNIRNFYQVLSLFGTNGFTDEHSQAVSQLTELEEIIFFLNGDDPGNKAVAKYAPVLKAEYPNLIITSAAVPQNEDVNSLLQGHSPAILTHLIDSRKEYKFLFSNEVERLDTQLLSVENKKVDKSQNAETKPSGLHTANPYNLKYQGNTCPANGARAGYQIKGFRVEQLDSLKITLQISINA